MLVFLLCSIVIVECVHHAKRTKAGAACGAYYDQSDAINRHGDDADNKAGNGKAPSALAGFPDLLQRKRAQNDADDARNQEETVQENGYKGKNKAADRESVHRRICACALRILLLVWLLVLLVGLAILLVWLLSLLWLAILLVLLWLAIRLTVLLVLLWLAIRLAVLLLILLWLLWLFLLECAALLASAGFTFVQLFSAIWTKHNSHLIINVFLLYSHRAAVFKIEPVA